MKKNTFIKKAWAMSLIFCGVIMPKSVKADAYEMLGHILPNRGIPCSMRDEQVMISPTTLPRTDEFLGMNLGQQSSRCR